MSTVPIERGAGRGWSPTLERCQDDACMHFRLLRCTRSDVEHRHHMTIHQMIAKKTRGKDARVGGGGGGAGAHVDSLVSVSEMPMECQRMRTGPSALSSSSRRRISDGSTVGSNTCTLHAVRCRMAASKVKSRNDPREYTTQPGLQPPALP